MSIRTEMISGFFGGALVKVAGALLGFAVSIILARGLGPGEYGVYAWVMAFVSLLLLPVQLGLPTLLIREAARAQQQRSWGPLKGLWLWSLRLTGASALFIGILVLGGVYCFGRVNENYLEVLCWGLLLMPLTAWYGLVDALLIGLRKVVLGQLSGNILRPGILLLMLLGVMLWCPDFRWAAESVMALTAIAGLLTLLIVSALLRRYRPIHLRIARPVYQPRVWFTSIGPLALTAGMQLINSYTDILMLGLLVSAKAAGIYRVSLQGAALVAFALQIVNMAVAPHFVRLHAAGQYGKLQRLVTKSAQVTLIGALPVVLLFWVFGAEVLRGVFGIAFEAGHTALVILALGQLINAGMGSVGLVLTMTGHERETLKGVTVSALLNIPLNFALIPSLGMAGAALATAISMVVWNILLWCAVRRHLGLNTTAFPSGTLTKQT